MPKIGNKYTRLYGDRNIVKVLSVSANKWVQIKDTNGVHFISLDTFEKYFREVDDEN